MVEQLTSGTPRLFMVDAGRKLRALREKCGLSIRDVEAASERLAQAKGNSEFALGIGQISDCESKGRRPSVFRLYAFSVIYKTSFSEILSWYGLDPRGWANDLALFDGHSTTRLEFSHETPVLRMPTAIDSAFDRSKTTDLGRAIQQWGDVPLAFIEQLATLPYIYAYVGTSDFSMYPLVLPGSFLQVDEKRHKVQAGPWTNEYERPIYFVETRERFHIGWCESDGSKLIVQPHPLSGEKIRTFRQPQEAEVLGQVVGVAMRLAWRSEASASMPEAQRLYS